MKWVEVADNNAALARFLRSHGATAVTMPSSSVQGGARTVTIAALLASSVSDRLTLPEAHEAGAALLADLVGGADTTDMTPVDSAIEAMADEMADARKTMQAAAAAVANAEGALDDVRTAFDLLRRARGLIK